MVLASWTKTLVKRQKDGLVYKYRINGVPITLLPGRKTPRKGILHRLDVGPYEKLKTATIDAALKKMGVGKVPESWEQEIFERFPTEVHIFPVAAGEIPWVPAMLGGELFIPFLDLSTNLKMAESADDTAEYLVNEINKIIERFKVLADSDFPLV